MTIEKNIINGSYIISDIVNDIYISRVYYDYTKQESIKLFRLYVRENFKGKS